MSSSVVNNMVAHAQDKLGAEWSKWESVVRRSAEIAAQALEARVSGDHQTAGELESALKSIAGSMDHRIKQLAFEAFESVVESTVAIALRGIRKGLS